MPRDISKYRLIYGQTDSLTPIIMKIYVVLGDITNPQLSFCTIKIFRYGFERSHFNMTFYRAMHYSAKRVIEIARR